MWRNCLEQITKFALIVFLLIPTLMPAEANAQMYEGVRDMHWSSSQGRCIGGGYNEDTGKHTENILDFNPFGNNSDINWELSNATCAAYIAATVPVISIATALSGYYCANATSSALYNASAAAGVALPPDMIKQRTKEAYICITQTNLCSNPVTAAAGCPAAATCCGALAAVLGVTALAVSGLAITYGVANGAYQKARICGYNGNGANGQSPWKSWSAVDASGNPTSEGGTWRKGAYEGSYKKYLQDKISAGATPDLKQEWYREYIFGGVEYEDNGDGACAMPDWSNDRKDQILGYHQKNNLVYYMTGSNESPVFACYRFLILKGTKEEIAAGQKAYDCCTKRSQNVMCIENASNVVGPAGNDYDYRFCQIGQRCNVKGVWFDAYISHSKANYACAKTYSGCPYNHPLGGGTEIQDYSDPDHQYVLQNYCQYMNHCQILPIQPYVVKSSLTGAFFDSSCRDLKGDSQNTYGYSSSLLPVDVRGFSSPMAQCFKETIENIFFNKAGSTACADPAETPDGKGVCASGYLYKKGDDLSAYQRSLGESGQSFFVKIQTALQDTIKMALSIAIMFFGVSILIGGSAITKKQLIPFVVKIAFVMYFATSNQWQDWVVNGILDSSAELSDIMFRTDSLSGTTSTSTQDSSTGQTVVQYVTDSNIDQSKLDGCQFPRYNYNDTNEATRYNVASYPPGKNYIRIWDTLDCKISRALGYGIAVSVPNLVMMILGGFLTGGAGVIFIVATITFAFCLIALTIRALHIFILSTVSIVVLLYVSPIMVTMVMFNKTKEIFNKWWKNILGFALQPMILFAYLGIMFTLFDNVIMGDVTFNGDGKNVPKEVICSGDAVNTSVYCIFNPPISGVGGVIQTNDQLRVLGVGLPVLATMNQEKISTLIKAAILFFILLSFLDKISELAKTLVGGEELKSNTMKTSDMVDKAYKGLDSIQQRGMGALNKHGGNIMKKSGSIAREGIAAMANRGSRTEQAPEKAPEKAGKEAHVVASGGQNNAEISSTASSSATTDSSSGSAASAGSSSSGSAAVGASGGDSAGKVSGSASADSGAERDPASSGGSDSAVKASTDEGSGATTESGESDSSAKSSKASTEEGEGDSSGKSSKASTEEGEGDSSGKSSKVSTEEGEGDSASKKKSSSD